MVAQATGAKRYAVVVGINDYTGTAFGNLNYCANDAEALYEAITTYAAHNPDDVVLFSDGSHLCGRQPTYSDILSEIKSMCEQAGEEDSILLAFAGHGTKDDQDSYLLTREFRLNVLADSSMSMAKINEYFQRSRAKFKIRLFDACHSGRMARAGLQNPNVAAHLAVEAEGWATLAACKEEESAYELSELGHGIFSYFLVRGLGGDAANGAGEVTMDTLKVYVMDRTIDLARARGYVQTPVFTGEQAGRLLLSRQGSAPAPVPQVLSAIQATSPEQLKPSASGTAGLLANVQAALAKARDSAPYVAASQEQKLAAVGRWADTAQAWAEQRIQQDAGAVPGTAQFVARRVALSATPLRQQMAEYLERSRVGAVYEWEREFELVTRRKKEARTETEQLRSMDFLFGMPARTVTRTVEVDVPYDEEVLAGVREPDGYPQSVVTLTFEPEGHLCPRCCMVVAIVPCSFGIFALCYFAATALGKGTEERWEPDSFTAHLFRALPIDAGQNPALTAWLDQAHAEFLAFIASSAESRAVSLERLGALEDTSVATAVRRHLERQRQQSS